MNKLLIKVLIAFVLGAVFSTGALLVLLLSDSLGKAQSPVSINYEPVPPSAITEQYVVPDAKEFTIRGTVTNNGWDRWDFVDVYAYLYVDGTRIRECVDSTDRSLRPGQRATFEVTCTRLATKDFSPKIRFELVAIRGVPLGQKAP
ncbi:MAG TPA: FxLYD domain-containing protein [Casimicrobium sp.]|nr:FxLYD domain-containing protein [Casimicrobium sp.]